MKSYKEKMKLLSDESISIITLDTGHLAKYMRHSTQVIKCEILEDGTIYTIPIEALYDVGEVDIVPEKTRLSVWESIPKKIHKKIKNNSKTNNSTDFIIATLIQDELIANFGRNRFNKIKNDDINELFNFITYGRYAQHTQKLMFIKTLKRIIDEFDFGEINKPSTLDKHEIKNLFFNFLLSKNPSIHSREIKCKLFFGKKQFIIDSEEKNKQSFLTAKNNIYSLDRSLDFLYNLYLQGNEFYPYFLKEIFSNIKLTTV